MMVERETGFPGLLHPRFGDGLGRVYFRPGTGGESMPQDSAWVKRYDLATGAEEVAATLWAPPVEQLPGPGGGLLPRLLVPRDDWAVGPDGRVAVIRARDYSVTWFLPDGSSVMGKPNAVTTFDLNRDVKEAYLPLMRSEGISMWSAASRGGGEVRMGMSRGLSQEGPGVDDFHWAESLPLFRPDRTRVSLLGEAWVERWLPPDSVPRMDIFDARGILSGAIELPQNRQLLGFGRAGSVDGEVAYLVRTDHFDLKWLERYRVVR
jgi:hypothetical protein